MQKQIRPDLMKKRLICCLCSAAIAITASRSLAAESHSSSYLLSSFSFNERRFTEEVKEYLGIPYRKGGTTRKGMDCSGFARTVYDRLLGIDLPQSSADQFQSRELEKIDTRELQTGDLVFFGSNKRKRINHVGIYLSDGQFIHASTSEGVMVSNLSDKYWRKRFVGSKRHHALSSLEELGENNSESLTQGKMLDNGVMSFYAASSARLEAETMEDLDFQAYSLPSPVGDNLTLDYQELSISHNLFDGFDLSLSAFNARSSSGPFQSNWSMIEGDAAMALADPLVTSSRQGVTLAGDYQASEWLSFTPSFTYFENGNNLDGHPKRSFGLNTQLCSIEDGWSLSMLMHFNDVHENDSLDNFDSKFSSFDLAFRFGIAITDNLQLSIMSKYDTRPGTLRTLDESSQNALGGGDVAMMFDFNY